MSDQQPPVEQSTGEPDISAPTAQTPPPPPPPPPASPSYPPPPPAYQPAPAPPAYAGSAPGGVPALPSGVALASKGRRVGAYFLSIVLAVVTLGIGYVIWGAIVWGRGTSPALQVLGMRAWRPAQQTTATWGTMALRNIIGGIVQGILSIITLLISFVMFLSDDQSRTIPDRIAGTLIVHDPQRVLG